MKNTEILDTLHGRMVRGYESLLLILGVTKERYPREDIYRIVQYIYWMIAVNLVAWSGYSAFYTVIGAEYLQKVTFFGIAVSGIVLVLVRYFKQLTFSVLFVSCATHVLLIFVSLGTGGVHSSLLIWIIANVTGLIFILPLSYSLLFSMGAVASFLLLYALSINVPFLHIPYDLPFTLESRAYGVYNVVNVSMAACALFVIAYLSRFMYQKGLSEVRDASHVKSNFLSTVSHEIRTPLNGIMGMMTLLQQSELDKSQKEYLDMMYTSSMSLIKMVNNVLDYSKLEAEKMSVTSDLYNAEELLSEIRDLFYPIVQEKGLSYTSDLDEELHENHCRGDRDRIQQVLINLVGNAIKFTFAGSIHVGMSVEGAKVLFQVVDSGVGISENAENIFAPFSQEDSTTTRDYGGTGLGLAISRRMVELMGGTIGYEANESGGTTFWFTSPLHLEKNSASPEAVIPPDRATPPRHGRRYEVLLVEDNDVNKIVAQKLLESYGCEVTSALNGEEAIALVRQQQYDIILMDLHMPVLDGVRSTELIRGYEREQGLVPTPIIAVTATVSDADHNRCILAGMQSVLIKPYSFDSLVTILDLYIQD